MAILHIIAGGFDQFVGNVFKGEGMPHQVQITLKNFYEIPICVVLSENLNVFSTNDFFILFFILFDHTENS